MIPAIYAGIDSLGMTENVRLFVGDGALDVPKKSGGGCMLHCTKASPSIRGGVSVADGEVAYTASVKNI